MNEPRPAGGEYATLYQYTPLNQLSSVTMVRDGVTQFRIFAYNGPYLVSTTFPENGTTTYTYNGNGQVSQKQDANGQKITYEYDANRRLKVVRRYPAGSAFDDPNQRTTNYYDTNPFDAAMNVYTYGRLAAMEYGAPQLGQVGPIREGYKYDQAGAITLKRMERGWRLEAGYTYDNEGRLATVTSELLISWNLR